MTNYLINDLRRAMVRVAANERWYDQCWLGVPVWQLPGDMLRLQQVVFEVQPKWIVETGTKFGGSAIFFASLMHLMGLDTGGVITTDIEILDKARKAISDHRFGARIRGVIEGDAAAQSTVDEITAMTDSEPGTVMVFLDDDHNAEHVYTEMIRYAKLVDMDSYLIVADTVFEDLAGTPVGEPTDKYPDVANSNPRVAVKRFLGEYSNFEMDMRFAGGDIGNFPDGFLRRIE